MPTNINSLIIITKFKNAAELKICEFQDFLDTYWTIKVLSAKMNGSSSIADTAWCFDLV